MLAFSGNGFGGHIRGEAYLESKRSEDERQSERKQKISGGDALTGHTRSHPEHDG